MKKREEGGFEGGCMLMNATILTNPKRNQGYIEASKTPTTAHVLAEDHRPNSKRGGFSTMLRKPCVAE